MTGPMIFGGNTRRGAARSFGAARLRVSYDETLALDDVSVDIPTGQVTAVVGGDGAGKTTLLRCLAGALQPGSGQLRTPGSRQIGYLPASSGTYPDLTVAENLAFRASAYGLSGPAAELRSAELVERAGLAAARERLAGQLSGGMRQKLGVIAALLHRPELLILDEPTTGIDPVSRSGLWWLIASAAADGAAVILSTTYIDDAQRAATVLVLDSGRQLAAGTPEHIVAAVPGAVVKRAQRPAGPAGDLAWRRGASWRVWCPPGTELAGQLVPADLQDAVTIAALAREPAASAEPAVSAEPVAGAAAEATEPAESAGGAAAGHAEPAARADLAGPFADARPVPPSGPLAECTGVTRRFGDFTAVRAVSIAVRPGEVVGLLGANGAGKTTLIRMLLGLIPASEGRVRLFGEPPSRRTRQRLGYVPQGLGLYEDLTAAENMAFAAAVFGSSPASLPADITSRAGVPVGRLPLGLQRRAAFAQALSHRPDLLILDEPTSGVDPLGRARLWQTIGDAARQGAGVLVSTHYMEEAGECDRLVIMADGRVVAAGPADTIVGAAQVTVVEASDWAVAFGRLEQSGLAVSLAGRVLRVPAASPAEVSRALARGGPAESDWRVYTAPATLEEKFFELALHATPDATAQGAVPA
ncbi:MAG: ATP-binding cassette domain-containing protein [Streptosporangiaceae bacterium]